MSDNQANLRELQRKRQNLDALRDVLSDAAFADAKRDLEAQIRALVQADGAVFTGDLEVRNGDVVGRDQVNNVIIVNAAREILGLLPQPSLSPEALQAATESFLHYLLDRHRYLDLQGMGVSDRVPLRLPLLDLYVPLKARLTLPEGETWQRGLKLAGRRLSEEEQAALTGR